MVNGECVWGYGRQDYSRLEEWIRYTSPSTTSICQTMYCMLGVERQVGSYALNNDDIVREIYIQIDNFANKYNTCINIWTMYRIWK